VKSTDPNFRFKAIAHESPPALRPTSQGQIKRDAKKNGALTLLQL